MLFEYAASTDDGRYPEEGMTLLGIIIGQSGFDELEKVLKKQAPGTEVEVELTFPDQFNVDELAGKTAMTTIKVDSVREETLPEIDEEFIRSFAIESGAMDEMRSEVRANLERELKGARLTYVKTQVLKRLIDVFPELEVPESMVHNEASQLQARDAQQRGEQPDNQQGRKVHGHRPPARQGGSADRRNCPPERHPG